MENQKIAFIKEILASLENAPNEWSIEFWTIFHVVSGIKIETYLGEANLLIVSEHGVRHKVPTKLSKDIWWVLRHLEYNQQIARKDEALQFAAKNGAITEVYYSNGKGWCCQTKFGLYNFLLPRLHKWSNDSTKSAGHLA